MRLFLQKFKPTRGFSHIGHLALLFILPLVMFVLVRLGFIQIALSIIVLSKWRMFAVRPRFWVANVRSNSIDLIIGLSTVLFMGHSTSLLVQFSLAILYGAWLLFIKPSTGLFMTSAQAFIGQFYGLTAVYLVGANGPVFALTLLTGLVCFLAARHFLDSFEEPYARMLSYYWGYFGAALAWLLSHWLLYYQSVAQATLLLTTVGYGLGVIYYLDHNDKLSKIARRQFIFIMIAIVLVVLVFSDWGDKAL
jgi:hypothetical protein